ncbi:unnamed protein product [Paramecium octaurelia]|uniref:Uncharacterized protein n=1 Tax=Paramecium octaurelia TaxID=43137 RepID=A0A8S1Y865_PAROT|nr:unnamed protein product [Paramecium octaurelia]
MKRIINSQVQDKHQIIERMNQSNKKNQVGLIQNQIHQPRRYIGRILNKKLRDSLNQGSNLANYKKFSQRLFYRKKLDWNIMLKKYCFGKIKHRNLEILNNSDKKLNDKFYQNNLLLYRNTQNPKYFNYDLNLELLLDFSKVNINQI